MFRKLFRQLFSDKTPTDFPGGFIANKFFVDRIDDGPILVIGDYNGRDLLPLKEKFEEIYLLDVADNDLVDDEYFVQQSIEKETPFDDGFFKYVIMSNVIEHIWEDKKAMEEIRRILDDDGRLLFCVPLYHDFHDRHFHIYSPNTVRLLFEHSGYVIEEKQFSRTITSIPNEIVAILAIGLYPIYGQKSLEVINNFLYKIHLIIAHSLTINKTIKFRFSRKVPSMLICAEKSENIIDPIEVQKEGYTKTK